MQLAVLHRRDSDAYSLACHTGSLVDTMRSDFFLLLLVYSGGEGAKGASEEGMVSGESEEGLWNEQLKAELWAETASRGE